LVERGNRVTLLCARVAGAPSDELREGVRYRRRGGRLTVFLAAAAALVEGRVDPDVVVDVQNGLPFLSPLVTRRPVLSFVHHVHREQWGFAFGPRAARLGWWVESHIAPALYRRSRYLTVSTSTGRELAGVVRRGWTGDDEARHRLASEDRASGERASGDRARLERVSHDRVSVVGIGRPELPAARQRRTGTPRIVLLGRLVPHKRFELALAAAAQLRARFPALGVDLLGRGYWEAQLRNEAVRLGVDDLVEFHGYVDEQTKADLLARAWVHVVPSVKEGWCIAVTEAAMCGTASVAFAGTGGLEESIVDGVTGVIVDAGVIVRGGAIVGDGGAAALGRTLESLLSNPPRLEQMGSAAREQALDLTWSGTIERVAELLDEAIAERQRPGRARPASGRSGRRVRR
jgi:glycosyltransferase involved in cell wall biosynthesis